MTKGFGKMGRRHLGKNTFEGLMTCSAIAGCVSATAACNNITPTDAVVIGFLGAIVYQSGVSLFLKLEIDDPLQVSQIHGFCGLWSLIATGIFDKERGLIVTGEFK